MASLWVNNTVYWVFPSCSSTGPPLLGADTDQSVPLEGCGGWNRGGRGPCGWGVAFWAVLKQCFFFFLNCSLWEVTCSHSCRGSCLEFYLQKGGLKTRGCSSTVTNMLVTSEVTFLANLWAIPTPESACQWSVSAQKSYEIQCGYEKMVGITNPGFLF